MRDVLGEYQDLGRLLTKVRKIIYDIYNHDEATYLSLRLHGDDTYQVSANLVTDRLTDEELKLFEVFLTRLEERLAGDLSKCNEHFSEIKTILGIKDDKSTS